MKCLEHVESTGDMYGHHLLKQSNMDQPRKVSKPARGHVERYVCMYGDMYIRAQFTAVYVCI